MAASMYPCRCVIRNLLCSSLNRLNASSFKICFFPNHLRSLSFSALQVSSRIYHTGHKESATEIPDIPELRPSPQAEMYIEYKVNVKGIVYDKKPFKFLCKKGKKYYWCTCGMGHTQPFCDATHKSPHHNIKSIPMLFIPEETREYWFCNCKQTSNPPFCDGTHRKPIVTDVKSVVRNV